MSLTPGGGATADLQPTIEDFQRQLAMAQVERDEAQHLLTESTASATKARHRRPR
jgi:hypothetical protein